jgi:ribosome-binding protein aMBF1 (putative translation factor)
MITGSQVRAAKALLKWSGTDLSLNAKVSISTIRRIEARDGLPDASSVKVLNAIKLAFEEAGIEFLGAPDNKPGVRLNFPSKS